MQPEFKHIVKASIKYSVIPVCEYSLHSDQPDPVTAHSTSKVLGCISTLLAMQHENKTHLELLEQHIFHFGLKHD